MSLKQKEIETYDYYTKEIANDEYVKKALLEEKIELDFKVEKRLSEKALIVSVKQIEEPFQSAVGVILLDTDNRFHGAYKEIKEMSKNILENTVYKK